MHQFDRKYTTNDSPRQNLPRASTAGTASTFKGLNVLHYVVAAFLGATKRVRVTTKVGDGKPEGYPHKSEGLVAKQTWPASGPTLPAARLSGRLPTCFVPTCA